MRACLATLQAPHTFIIMITRAASHLSSSPMSAIFILALCFFLSLLFYLSEVVGASRHSHYARLLCSFYCPGKLDAKLQIALWRRTRKILQTPECVRVCECTRGIILVCDFPIVFGDAFSKSAAPGRINLDLWLFT